VEKPIQTRRTVAVLAAAALLSACGGGTGDSPFPPAPSPSPSPAPCAGSTQDDAWVNQRAGCVQAGSRMVSLSGGQALEGGDVAFVVKQKLFLNSFSSATQFRHFASFLCMKDGPRVANLSQYGVSLATDVSVAMKVANQYVGSQLPAMVSAVSISIAGTNRPAAEATTCDPAKHFLIVDYATGNVLSVNPGATLVVYDTDS